MARRWKRLIMAGVVSFLSLFLWKGMTAEAKDIGFSYTITKQNSFEGLEWDDTGEEVYCETYQIHIVSGEETGKNSDGELTVSAEGILPRDASIVFTAKDGKADSNREIEVPVFTSDAMYRFYEEANRKGNRICPSGIGVSLYVPKRRGGQEIPYRGCVTYVSVLDEYEPFGIRKRHHIGFDAVQQMPNFSAKYLLTSKGDENADRLDLSWNIGGATVVNAETVSAEVQYDFYEFGTRYQNKRNEENLEADFGLCTGQGIGFRVPDAVLSDDSLYRVCYPSSWQISGITGWYNVGGYDGCEGAAMGALFHTFSKGRRMEIGGASVKLSPF